MSVCTAVRIAIGSVLGEGGAGVSWPQKLLLTLWLGLTRPLSPGAGVLHEELWQTLPR